jgi:type 1 glutamine amidotransferase
MDSFMACSVTSIVFLPQNATSDEDFRCVCPSQNKLAPVLAWCNAAQNDRMMNNALISFLSASVNQRLSLRWMGILAVMLLSVVSLSAAPIKTLIVEGQSNGAHNMSAVTVELKKILESAGLFSVEIATTPAKGQDMSGFKPNFSAYDLVVVNYDGDSWAADTQAAFVKYLEGGGGLVVVHSADNAFGSWKEFNEMIGVGGWGGRTEKSGPYLRLRDGKWVALDMPGPGGSHGKARPYVVTTRQPNHPVMRGLPSEWLHVSDELYDRLRGPAKNVTVLASAMTDAKTGGSGEEEPVLMAISYGRGRVFHSTMGHSTDQMKCVGFIVTLQRGAEWAATSKVTQKTPADFPTATETKTRP